MIENSPSNDPITFIIAVNDEEVLRKNIFLSPVFTENQSHQIITQRGFRSAALAFNSAIEHAENDLLVFVHQDVFLVETWMQSLRQSIFYIEKEKINWGVVGCYGIGQGGIGGVGRVYTNGTGLHGREIDKPEPVQTLDEIVLVVRKSSGLRFDPTLPHFHLYGADICMSAREKSMMSYAIPAFCIHNNSQLLTLPKEFYECYRHVKRRWKKYLPIYTSCIKISRFDGERRLRRIKEIRMKLLKTKTLPKRRVEDPRTLIDGNLFIKKSRTLA